MFKPPLSSLVLFACVACGSSFDASGSDGAAGSHASPPEAGATAMGGDSSNGASGGESSGGSSSGAPGSAGESSSGGDSTMSNGGTAAGGDAVGGSSTSAGAGGDDCAALKTEYAALVKKARVCDQGSLDQCSTASKAPTIGCGCPTLVNANSQYTALAADKYKAIQKGKCDGGLTCALGCLPPTSASCAQSTGMGSSEFVCTGTNGGVAN